MKNNLRRYDVIRKVSSDQSNNCTTGCLLDYPYFKKYYKLIAIDLSKQQKTMLIQKQYNKLILLEMQVVKEGQTCFS